MVLHRRRLCQLAASSAAWSLVPGWLEIAGAQDQAANTRLDFAAVQAKARGLAEQPYHGGDFQLPDALLELPPDNYNQISYRPEYALWQEAESAFRVMFFHLGAIYRQPVMIHLVDDGQVGELSYSPDMFEFGVDGFADSFPAGLGFAGLSVHHVDGSGEPFDFTRFRGASYFRLRGREQSYGLSARGLAIDTALPKGEEFPFFREFWLNRPAPDAAELTLFALLDSLSVTGAYRFVLRPGLVTVVDVNVSLFPRGSIEKLGIAPLTSMFLFGENRGRAFDDFRPEVHTSDGLLINNGRGEWIWRPLANHRALQISAFMDENPRGFGLYQRDRDFAAYQDLQAEFQRRPSVWVEPLGEWGPGAVELVEIPSDQETNDNVVAFWVARAPVEAGRPIEMAYRLHAQLDQPPRPPLGRVKGTWIGPGKDGARRFTLDFAGGPLSDLGADAPLELAVESHQGRLGPPALLRNSQVDGWRAWFDLYPDGEELCEMRCFLRLQGEQVTETWVYRWTPV